MSLNQRSELCKRGEDQEDPRENQDLLEEQLFGAEEEEEAISSSSSFSQSVLFPDNPEEVAAAVAPSPPQSPQGVCPSPSAMEAVPWSQSEAEMRRGQAAVRTPVLSPHSKILSVSR